VDKKEEMETAGSYTAKMGTGTTIRARVLDKNGNLIEDLGIIVGKRTKRDGNRSRAALARLAKNYKGGKHGS